MGFHRATLTEGGTADGDVTVTGDLTVDTDFSVGGVVATTFTVQGDDASAFVVEEGDGTDVFAVDTVAKALQIRPSTASNDPIIRGNADDDTGIGIAGNTVYIISGGANVYTGTAAGTAMNTNYNITYRSSVDSKLMVGESSNPLVTAGGFLWDRTNNELEILHADVSDTDGVIRIPGTATTEVIIQGRDPGAVGPTLTLFHDSDSPGADDEWTMNFDGRNDGASQFTYAQISGGIITETAGSEEGFFDLLVADGAGGQGGINVSAASGSTSFEAINEDDDLQFITTADSGTPNVIFSPANTVAFNGSTQAITDTTAIDVVTQNSTLSNGGAQANGMTDGTQEGQMKVVRCIGAGTYTVTPTTFFNGTTLTMPTLSSATLMWTAASGWVLWGSEGVTVA
tara:strand:+ start:514 stop:1710 length:1197 start_codon:yes stop_codon:yes gene_type:complete